MAFREPLNAASGLSAFSMAAKFAGRLKTTTVASRRRGVAAPVNSSRVTEEVAVPLGEAQTLSLLVLRRHLRP
jgi:hypothetical protein